MTIVDGEPRCETCGQLLAGSPIREVDWPAFGTAVRMEMARQNLSYRECAAKIGVDQATIHRAAKHGKPVRVEAYLALLAFCEPHPKEPVQ